MLNIADKFPKGKGKGLKVLEGEKKDSMDKDKYEKWKKMAKKKAAKESKNGLTSLITAEGINLGVIVNSLYPQLLLINKEFWNNNNFFSPEEKEFIRNTDEKYEALSKENKEEVNESIKKRNWDNNGKDMGGLLSEMKKQLHLR